MNAFEYLRQKSPRLIFFWGVVLVLLFGFMDYLTGPELAFSIFYLIPVCSAAWFGGRWAGFSMALLSGLVWFLAEWLCNPPYSHIVVPIWNSAVRFGLFAVSGALTAEVAERKRVENLLRQQTSILQSILNSMGDGVIVADATGKIILFNPAAERLLRINLAEAGADWLKEQDTFLPDQLTVFPTHEHPLLRAIHGESVDGAEMFLRYPQDSTEVWLSVTSRPLSSQNTVRGGVMVFSDITSRKILEKQIAEVSEREQRRMGQDLHDGLCQHLVSTGFASAILQNKLQERKIPEATDAGRITDLINDAITQARALARGLYPVKLEVDGLPSALEQLAESVQNLTRINCEFRCEEPVQIHSEVAGTNLYRIAQEAVNNAIKHGRAKNLVIELEAVENEVTLSVSDDGIGFSPELKKENGMGLSIMNYRARLIGASLDIRRGSHGGTTVVCSFVDNHAAKSK
jgi:signal transduction histidine kinase